MVLRNALCAIFLAHGLVAWPQDALRYSQAGEQAALAQARALQDQNYSLRLGNARLLANTSLSLELNDNITLAQSHTEQDAIFRPQVETRLIWPLTQRNALNFSLGLGYAKYVNHAENDFFVITPGSELSLDLFVKNFKFTIFERFSYTQDPIQNGAVSNVSRYGGLDNAVGLNAVWDLNEAILNAGYSHANFVPDQTAFEYLTRASELFIARAAFMPWPVISFGPEASGGITTYDSPRLNDSISYSAGVFAIVHPLHYLAVDVHGGFVGYEFDQQSSAKAGNPQSYYFRISVEHTLNKYLTHSLQGGREITLGVYSDYLEQYYARYDASIKLFRNIELGVQAFYEHGAYPQTVSELGPGSASFAGDTYDRFGSAVSLSYRLRHNLTSTLAYRLTIKDSASRALGYTQNSLTFGFVYQF